MKITTEEFVFNVLDKFINTCKEIDFNPKGVILYVSRNRYRDLSPNRDRVYFIYSLSYRFEVRVDYLMKDDEYALVKVNKWESLK